MSGKPKQPSARSGGNPTDAHGAYDKLIDSQAKSYAAVLSVAVLKGVAAFYDTPAGHNFVAAQPRLAQAYLAASTSWMQGIAPERQAKLQQSIKARGWSN